MAAAARTPPAFPTDLEVSRPETVEIPITSEMPSTAAPRKVGNVVLDIRDLKTYFYTYDGVVKALDGVSFKVRSGETLGLVGETGCGKSVTAFSTTRLIADPPGRVMSGTILFRGANLLWGLDKEARFKPQKKTNRVKVSRKFHRIKAAQERMNAVRGAGISMIFQEPTAALNPIFSISNQLGEAILLHRGDEIYEGLLRADPEAAAHTKAAVEELLNVAVKNDPVDLRKASAALSEQARLPTIATQVFHTLRHVTLDPSTKLPEIQKALQRTRLSGLRRRFLEHLASRYAVDQELKAISFSEMRNGRLEKNKRRAVGRRLTSLKLRGLFYRLPGIKGYVNKPLKEEVFWKTVQLLEGVTIANPVQVARGFPHELSGGMLQRVMIAMALSSDPEVLIADEPTTALDVTIQAQILQLMKDLKQRVGTAILLITHDLAVIAEVSDRVCVMYAGQIVETAAVKDLFSRPLHPYSQGLLSSIPRLDRPDKRLESIPGSVPNLIFPPPGCRFHPRCPYAMPICKEARPPTTVEGPGRTVACYLYKGPVAVE